MTASHCTDHSYNRGPTGTLYWQNQQVPGPINFIGIEVHDAPPFQSGVCPDGKMCRWSDSAGMMYYGPAESMLGRIYRTTGFGSITIADSPNDMVVIRANLLYPLDGDVLHKVGRTTGWSDGIANGTCLDVLPIDHRLPPDHNLLLLSQFAVTGAVGTINAGDSGGPVFKRLGDDTDPDVELAGIVVGRMDSGAFFLSAMREIFRDNELPSPHGSVTH